MPWPILGYGGIRLPYDSSATHLRYIYLGIVTTSLILVMNTLVLCETEVRPPACPRCLTMTQHMALPTSS